MPHQEWTRVMIGFDGRVAFTCAEPGRTKHLAKERQPHQKRHNTQGQKQDIRGGIGHGPPRGIPARAVRLSRTAVDGLSDDKRIRRAAQKPGLVFVRRHMERRAERSRCRSAAGG